LIRPTPQRPGHKGLFKESGKLAIWKLAHQADSSDGRNSHGTQLSQGMVGVSVLGPKKGH